MLGGALLPAALAMLGLWTVLGSSAGERASIVWLVVLASACALIGGGAAGSLAPASLAFWLPCAMGLADVRRALSDAASRRAWAVVLAIALVVLQTVEMRSRENPADRLPRGHYSLSRRSLLQLLEAVPEGAAIASEDAVTGWLVRALPGPVRARFRLHETPVDEHAVSERLTTSRLFALPRGQWRAFAGPCLRVCVVGGATRRACRRLAGRSVAGVSPPELCDG